MNNAVTAAILPRLDCCDKYSSARPRRQAGGRQPQPGCHRDWLAFASRRLLHAARARSRAASGLEQYHPSAPQKNPSRRWVANSAQTIALYRRRPLPQSSRCAAARTRAPIPGGGCRPPHAMSPSLRTIQETKQQTREEGRDSVARGPAADDHGRGVRATAPGGLCRGPRKGLPALREDAVHLQAREVVHDHPECGGHKLAQDEPEEEGPQAPVHLQSAGLQD